jgi:hypothetical protein
VGRKGKSSHEAVETTRLASLSDFEFGVPDFEPARVGPCNVGSKGLLPNIGPVAVVEKLARFVRPGLIEEYSVSVDGIRQDFLVVQRPDGEGKLRVEMHVAGAKAGATMEGAHLVLNHSGRKIAYSRLRTVDA